ncbi:hypothetical protein IFM89_014413 [Coptis chinensis]|uniref:WRKY domain-containing protein n=1 Tax=Coptis chinensis TaxID=261450 RepID=A0A835LZW9_9MAGN|nr:hypothetical protein IFM89_014413 [Coptis chinensis]
MQGSHLISYKTLLILPSQIPPSPGPKSPPTTDTLHQATMADYTSQPTYIPQDFNNSNHTYTYLMDHLDLIDFEVSDFLIPEAGSEEDSTSTQIDYGQSNPVLSEKSDETMANVKSGMKKTKTDVGVRIAFRTKSELEIMDDGYKWRKYGKKAVKNTPNPSGSELVCELCRNYYRCSHQGCHVKKRVEREKEDPSYVITTYDGVHNHESPSIVYYNEMPLMVPNGWTLQASHQASC